MRQRLRIVAWAVVVTVYLATPFGLLASPANTATRSGAQAELRVVERFRYDNDLFIARDDAFFTGGFGQEVYSAPLDGWDRRPSGAPRRAFARWIGENVPGLGPADGRFVRFGSGFAHASQTPDDLRTSEPQLTDVPYAATIGIFGSWAALDDRALNAFQIYAGVVGPCAGGREVYDLFHNSLARGPISRGWRWQLENEPLFNLSYAVKRKISPAMTVVGPGWQGDLALSFHQALGTYRTATDLQLEFRAGPRLPPGFADIPDPIGRGVGLAPTLELNRAAPGRPRVEAVLAVRASALWHTPLLDGGTFRRNVHPGVEYDPIYLTAVAGLRLEYRRISAQVSYFGSGIDPELGPGVRSSPSWLTVTLEVRR